MKLTKIRELVNAQITDSKVATYETVKKVLNDLYIHAIETIELLDDEVIHEILSKPRIDEMSPDKRIGHVHSLVCTENSIIVVVAYGDELDNDYCQKYEETIEISTSLTMHNADVNIGILYDNYVVITISGDSGSESYDFIKKLIKFKEDLFDEGSLVDSTFTLNAEGYCYLEIASEWFN